MKKNHGFTLIEMMVAIGIFSVAIIMGITAVVSIINANRISQSESLIFSNLSIAMESMTKSIRVGTDYQGDGNSASASISFVPSSNQGRVEYAYDNVNFKIVRKVYNENGDPPVINDLTPDQSTGEINIDELTFTIDTSSQPRVLIRLKGHSRVRQGDAQYFYLQSMVSQRII